MINKMSYRDSKVIGVLRPAIRRKIPKLHTQGYKWVSIFKFFSVKSWKQIDFWYKNTFVPIFMALCIRFKSQRISLKFSKKSAFQPSTAYRRNFSLPFRAKRPENSHGVNLE